MNAVKSSVLPRCFSASIGGFLGSSYSVELRDAALTYTTTDLHYESPQSTTIRPTEAQWGEFRYVLDELNVWQWLSDYPNPGILDGSFWSLDISYSELALTTQGVNNYPMATGKPNNKPDPTKTFNRLLHAISQLTGRSFE